MDELAQRTEDLAHLARLAVSSDREEVRVFVARLVRRYRRIDAELSERLETSLRTAEKTSARSYSSRGRDNGASSSQGLDREPDLSLLRSYPSETLIAPIFSESTSSDIADLISEREKHEELSASGLRPISSAIFVGPPGVGKTHAARWLSDKLDLPLFALDLTSVMSSLLGQSGSNLRSVLDYAKRIPSVLFLDEIDAIGKSRSDQSDIGEIKRLVTILLQELDEWPATSVVLAATNHPELVDRALWRRFDQVIQFENPTEDLGIAALKQYLGDQLDSFEPFVESIAKVFTAHSYSDLRRVALAMRKEFVLGNGTPEIIVSRQLAKTLEPLKKSDRIELAVGLTRSGVYSQHEVARITELSRDTIRKYSKIEISGGQPLGD